MPKLITILLCTLLISGCSIFQNSPTNIPQVIIHPELPRPVSFDNINWIIIEQNNEIYVATDYQSFLNGLQNRENMIRYISQLINTTCYYRKELQEEFCQPTKSIQE